MSNPRIVEAIALMQGFAERTGLTGGHPPRRYLWTDAFAVCNYLGLAQATGDQRYTTLALQLVDQVHHALGRHRDDDPRAGWLSGLNEQEGERHPTLGGLRIGKTLPERGPDQPLDERLEWERDGQYFHYLTQWMHALDQVAQSTGQPRFNRWARELATTAHEAFTYLPSPTGPLRMYWKMSIDLTRALVPSMGQHDPLDGYISYLELQATAATLPEADTGPSLMVKIGQLVTLLENAEWDTADPLGIGSLLTDAHRVDGLLRQRVLSDEHLLDNLLAAALTGLQYYAKGDELGRPAKYRLAFRELGLAIGLHAAERMWQAADSEAIHSSANPGIHARLKALMQYAPMRNEIESFWRDPAHHNTDPWSEHRDINEVMLATSLVPEGFLIKRTLNA
jgi:hypothetical protein